jgi:hypothetical protein
MADVKISGALENDGETMGDKSHGIYIAYLQLYMELL